MSAEDKNKAVTLSVSGSEYVLGAFVAAQANAETGTSPGNPVQVFLNNEGKPVNALVDSSKKST